MKIINVSAAQITCRDGKVTENLAHASELVEQASRQGTQLVLFPEFMPQGYRTTPELWDCGEPFDGPTTHWLRVTAQTFNLYVGTSFLEARGNHFFNTFALAGPDGKLAGQVGKRNPSMYEAYFFKGDDRPHFIDTDLGRIGVGICFDNHTYQVASMIAQNNVDLMLMPHCYATPTVANRMASSADIERLNELPGRVAGLYNRWFGIPVVVCNKSGEWNSPVPWNLLGDPAEYHYRFSGRSMILDSDGQLKASLIEEENVITAPVQFDPTRKKQSRPEKYSRYIYPGSAGREILRLLEAAGKMSYTFSARRKAAAREESQMVY
jgi:N-carbamoylputrescine amidase